VDAPVPLSNGELPVGGEVELPAELVNQMVMSSAERDHILEIGQTAELERVDVVNLALSERDVAVTEPAGATCKP
jgi:hypothetical protein